MKEFEKCRYCGDPIYLFQRTVHEGCAKLAAWNELTKWIESNSYINCDIIHIHNSKWQMLKGERSGEDPPAEVRLERRAGQSL